MSLVSIVAIHRGRNQKTTTLFKSQTSRDYNFDYRGLAKPSFISPILLYIKAYITSLEIPEAKIYLIEGTQLALVGFFLKRRYPRSKIAVLLNGPEFQWLESWGWFKKFRFNWRMRTLRKKVDLFLPISKVVERDLFLRVSPSANSRIIPPFLFSSARFHSIEREPSKASIFFVIERPADTSFVKGLDRVLKIFKRLRQLRPDATLTLIGSGTEAMSDRANGISGLGFQQPEDYLPEGTIILSPARYEAFNLSIAEGIACGLLPIVSENVGARDLIEKVSSALTLPGEDSELWAQKIVQLLSLSAAERRGILAKLQIEVGLLSQKASIEALDDSIATLR